MGPAVAKSATARRSGADPINPDHYKRNGIELGDVFEAWEMGYWDGCAAKYLFRAKYKGKRLEDLRKARRCLEKEIARLEREDKP